MKIVSKLISTTILSKTGDRTGLMYRHNEIKMLQVCTTQATNYQILYTFSFSEISKNVSNSVAMDQA